MGIAPPAHAEEAQIESRTRTAVNLFISISYHARHPRHMSRCSGNTLGICYNILWNQPYMDEILSIIPLGGVEEIGGLNMTVLRYADDIIVIDAGLMFPDDTMLGVDFVIQDFAYLFKNADKIQGIFLTHGHEDHVGSLPFLLKDIDIPVYGTALTLGFVQEKLKEYKMDGRRLQHIKPKSVIQAGAFRVEAIRVTHSIVDGVAYGITTPLGCVVHTGDFKVDPTPVDGEILDFRKFTEYGEKGALLLLSDSTNSEQGGFTFSEKEVRRAFEEIFSTAEGRILLSTFSSNIHRIQQAIDVAYMYDRKVIICGRSIVTNTDIAIELGYLKVPPETIVEMEALENLDDEDVVIITTGSQGEPMSVLSRIAVGEHKHIKIHEGDTVIISAKAIPGNERSIGKLINRLFKLGADVIHEKVSEIHVSGHASKEELKLMLSMVRPKYFMPIHGEYRNLVNHAKLARKLGIPRENIFLMENGNVLKIDKDGAAIDGKVEAGRVFIDGKGVGDVEEMVLRDRRRLGHDGIVIPLITIEKEYGKLLSHPEIITRGFIHEGESTEIIDTLVELLSDTIGALDRQITSDPDLLKEETRAVLRRYIRKTMDRRPMVMPIVFEV
jgi:ribonuclease J